jgi:hypothetical protein
VTTALQRAVLDYLASDPKLPADSENGAPSASVEQPVRKIHIVGCPAHDEVDEVALLIFRQLIDPMRYDVEVLSASILVSEMTAAVAEKKPPLVCISALPPGGLVQACHLCKRLRALFPRIKIVVGRWSSAGALDDGQNSLLAAGADQVGSSLLQTRDQLLNLRQFIS